MGSVYSCLLYTSLGRHHLYLALGLQVFDDVHHRLGHPAGHREPAAVRRGLIQALVARYFGKIDGLGLKHAHHFLEGEHKIHIAADGAAAGLQLFGRARANNCLLYTSAVGRIVGESAALLFTAGVGTVVASNMFAAFTRSGGSLSVALYMYVSERGEFDVGFAIAAILMVLVLCVNGAAKLAKNRLSAKKR